MSDSNILRDLQQSILECSTIADFMAVKKTVEAIVALPHDEETPPEWVTVPRRATAAMLWAADYGFSYYGGHGGAYRAMIEAAPRGGMPMVEALKKIAGSHWERIGYDQTDIDDVPDLTAVEAMILARAALEGQP